MTDAARAAIRELATLPPPAIEEFRQFLSTSLEVLQGPDETYIRCASLKRVDRDLAFHAIDALAPYIFGHISASTDPKSAVDDIVRAVGARPDGSNWKKSDDKRLKQYLTVLLLDPLVLLKSKSVRLLSTHKNDFTDCEIISDIRPVFSTDGKLTAEAAVLCHSFRIGYATESGPQSFFVTLDSNDLITIKNAVDRAIAKKDVLEKVISKSGLVHVKVS
jgi:hypothetical protein